MRRTLKAALVAALIAAPFTFGTPHADAACNIHVGENVQVCAGPGEKLGAVVNVPLIHACIQINRLCG